MTKIRFSTWITWPARNEHAGAEYPGVYVIARTPKDLTGKPFSWRREIIYIGMTNAAAGLRGRLQQFDNTIAGKLTQHGGADRVRYKFRAYNRLRTRLYVAVAVFECNVNSATPTNLRVMGRVAEFEYECLATFAERFGRIPMFNDKKHAPKYSLMVARRSHRRRVTTD